MTLDPFFRSSRKLIWFQCKNRAFLRLYCNWFSRGVLTERERLKFSFASAGPPPAVLRRCERGAAANPIEASPALTESNISKAATEIRGRRKSLPRFVRSSCKESVRRMLTRVTSRTPPTRPRSWSSASFTCSSVAPRKRSASTSTRASLASKIQIQCNCKWAEAVSAKVVEYTSSCLERSRVRIPLSSKLSTYWIIFPPRSHKWLSGLNSFLHYAVGPNQFNNSRG